MIGAEFLDRRGEAGRAEGRRLPGRPPTAARPPPHALPQSTDERPLANARLPATGGLPWRRRRPDLVHSGPAARAPRITATVVGNVPSGQRCAAAGRG
ncbi:hypothetical protein [Phytohabitans rumicis]|uniref:hypothetical protein n=1 Tax=Phytohabitans rumicis TaxID=1076125 RepID=UPI0031F00C89